MLITDIDGAYCDVVLLTSEVHAALGAAHVAKDRAMDCDRAVARTRDDLHATVDRFIDSARTLLTAYNAESRGRGRRPRIRRPQTTVAN